MQSTVTSTSLPGICPVETPGCEQSLRVSRASPAPEISARDSYIGFVAFKENVIGIKLSLCGSFMNYVCGGYPLA